MPNKYPLYKVCIWSRLLRVPSQGYHQFPYDSLIVLGWLDSDRWSTGWGRCISSMLIFRTWLRYLKKTPWITKGFKSARASMHCLEFIIMMCPMHMHMMSVPSKKDRSLAMDAQIRQAYISILQWLEAPFIILRQELWSSKRYSDIYIHLWHSPLHPSMVYLPTCFMVNVGKYTIHGWYGFYNHPVEIMCMKHLSPAPLAPYDIQKPCFCPGVWGYHLRLCACQPISGLGSIPVTWRIQGNEGDSESLDFWFLVPR